MRPYDVWRYANNLTGNHWTTFNEDVRKNGYICGACHERFGSSYPVVVCSECVEKNTHRFDRRPDLTYKNVVYALYSEGECVYIGITKNPAARFNQHVVDKDFDFMGIIKGFSNRAKALEFEAFCIEKYRPKYNRMVKAAVRKIPWQWAQDLERVTTEAGSLIGTK